MDKNQLSQLIELGRRHTDAATRNLGDSHSRARAEEDKLALLEQYRRDYQTQLGKDARSSLTSGALRNYHEFLNKLDAAIEQQRKQLTACRQQLESSRTEWQNAQRKLKSFDALNRREAVREKRQRARREQSEQDEHTAAAQDTRLNLRNAR
ncbi:MAG TPA: flagellar export protein FliJ [Burkholderiales bacterium]|nr:flagellar export protein FliJ [Burkholderiales bacterium]